MGTRRSLLLLLISCLAAWISINSSSLWIDEGNAAIKACAPTFHDWQAAMSLERGSDAQMPLYMAWLWGWEKIVGPGERMLRLGNIPWLLLAHGFLLLALRRARMNSRVSFLYIALAAIAPFLCYYLNEARPYVMQYAGGCLILAYLLRVAAAPEDFWSIGTVLTGALGMVITSGSSLLGISWAGSGVLAASWLLWKARKNKLQGAGPATVVIITGLVAAMGGLGFYYWGTLKGGARATMGRTDLASTVFALYEIFGFSGLGPGRIQMRETGIHALATYAVPLGTGALILLGGWTSSLVVRLRSQKSLNFPTWILVAVVLPVAFTFGVGMCAHFRVLARHLMPGFPYLLLLMAVCFEALWRSRLKMALVLCAGVWIASSAMLCFSPIHRKDDYKSSAALARKALEQGERVWWAADIATAKYYGLNPAGEPCLVTLRDPEPDLLLQNAEPDLIIISKPDIYDSQGTMEKYAATHNFSVSAKYPAFTFYEKRR